MVRISIGIATKKGILVSAAASTVSMRVILILSARWAERTCVFRYKCNAT